MSERAGSRLCVYLNEEMLGAVERRGPARYRFTYSDETLTRHGEGSVLLSASLPVRAGSFSPSRSAPFFEGLLPEATARIGVARRFGLSEADGFGLLSALGADCAGAVVVLPVDRSPLPERSGVELLSVANLESLVGELPRRPLGVSADPDGVRLSLGGVQDKLVLTRSADGRFGLPKGGWPSTCLVKPDYGHYEDIAANEAFCMRVAAGVGLDAAVTELFMVGQTPCLYVERFDRSIGRDGAISRIHQEDMCQALGLLPAAKYEENGGPSVAAIVGLLRTLGSPRAAVDINAFVKAVLVSFLLGNSDAHGKNFALLYESDAAMRLAPLYDIVSTAVYPEVTSRLAMRIGGVDDPADVGPAAWELLAMECGLGGQLGRFVREWTGEILALAVGLRDRARAEGWHRPVIDRIVEVCQQRSGHLINSS
jgi:serine/threonine-protein kinase HipA